MDINILDKNLLSFPINYKLVLKHLLQDMRDDWFYDTVKYQDLLTNEKSIIEVLSKNLEINHGEYQAGHKSIYDVPKRALGLRYTLELDFYDRFLYQSICTYLIQFFDPLLSNRVFSHRYNKHGDRKYIFKHKIELWNTFENISHLAFDDNKTLLVTDLLNYFEQITIESIEKAFISMISKVGTTGAEKNKIRNAVKILLELLEKWCYSGKHGLPQNRDASSFVANVVLDVVDKHMVNKGYDYFRYVDDIRIICSDELEAKRALNDLIFELRKLNLNINSKKTAILSKSSGDIDDHFPSKDDTVVLIDTMWKTRSKKVITRSIPILHQLLTQQIEKGETQSRPFRFCINRFKTLISSNLFDSGSIVASNIADILILELGKQPVSTDQFCKILMDLELSDIQLQNIASFTSNKNIAIHGWQNYNLILLMAHKRYQSECLVDHCISLISDSENVLSPEVPACFIYLSSVGLEKKVEEFINIFESNWPYQHQRYFLIALQKCDQKILKPILKKIDFRLKGTIVRFKKTKKLSGKTIYLNDFNPTTIDQIYDEISPYE